MYSVSGDKGCAPRGDGRRVWRRFGMSPVPFSVIQGSLRLDKGAVSALYSASERTVFIARPASATSYPPEPRSDSSTILASQGWFQRLFDRSRSRKGMLYEPVESDEREGRQYGDEGGEESEDYEMLDREEGRS